MSQCKQAINWEIDLIIISNSVLASFCDRETNSSIKKNTSSNTVRIPAVC